MVNLKSVQPEPVEPSRAARVFLWVFSIAMILTARRTSSVP